MSRGSPAPRVSVRSASVPTRRLASPDPVLHRIAPFGLAAAAGTALVVDLDPGAGAYPGPSLRDLVDGSLTADHLRPRAGRVGVIANGGIVESEAVDVLSALVGSWPAVVLRVPLDAAPLPVLPMDPPEIAVLRPHRAVWQASTRGSSAPGAVLPPLRRSVVRALCRGTVESRSRWVRAWRQVWGSAWE